MEKVTLGEALLSLIVIIGYIVRTMDSKRRAEDVKTSQQNAANSTRIFVKEEETITRQMVSQMIDESTSKLVAERVAQTEAMGRFEKAISTINLNTKRLCAHAGIEWKDDITLVPDHTKQPKE